MAWNRPKPGTDVPMPADIVHQALRGELVAGYCDHCGGCLCHECDCDHDLDDDQGTGHDLKEVANHPVSKNHNVRPSQYPEPDICSDCGGELYSRGGPQCRCKQTVSQFEPLQVIERWLGSHHLAGGVGAELVVKSYNGGASAKIQVGRTTDMFSVSDSVTIEGALIALAEEIKFWCGY